MHWYRISQANLWPRKTSSSAKYNQAAGKTHLQNVINSSKNIDIRRFNEKLAKKCKKAKKKS